MLAWYQKTPLGISMHAYPAMNLSQIPPPDSTQHQGSHLRQQQHYLISQPEVPVSNSILPPLTPPPPLLSLHPLILQTPPPLLPPPPRTLTRIRAQRPLRQIPPPTEQPLITMSPTIRVQILLMDLTLDTILELCFLPRGGGILMPAPRARMPEFAQGGGGEVVAGG